MTADVSPLLTKEMQQLAPSAVIELFKLEIPNVEGATYFHAGTNEFHSDIVWQGQTYLSLPLSVEGFDISAKGELPRPKLSIANVKGLFSGLIRLYDDLVGAKITRKRTFAKYLDAINFKNGNATADPQVQFPDDIWYIDVKKSENKLSITWELASAFDLQGVKLPRRQIIQNYCQWKYRGGECGWTGGYVDINDNPCTSEADDCCAKKLSSCKARFITMLAADDNNVVLPFGGFPGATRSNG